MVSDTLTTAKKGEEHPDRNADEHLGARLPHPGEEAGSIVFHSSSNTSEIRNDNNESRATEAAAAKVSEDTLVKDAEILRLEERRNTPKGEKHKLKDVSKCIKRCIREKKRMKRQMDIQRILEDFKGLRNKISKEESTHHKDKKRERRMHHISERNCRCLWRILQKIYDDTEQDESEQELSEDENKSSTDVHYNNTDEMTRIPEITTEELQLESTNSKKRQIPGQQRNSSRRHERL